MEDVTQVEEPGIQKSLDAMLDSQKRILQEHRSISRIYVPSSTDLKNESSRIAENLSEMSWEFVLPS